MMVFLHEMRQNAKMLAVWSVVIGGMVVLCVAMFPDISAQSEDFTAMFSSLGVFTEAFGMDQLSIGEPLGFFGVECGAVLGIGAYGGISAHPSGQPCGCGRREAGGRGGVHRAAERLRGRLFGRVVRGH